MRPFIPIPFWLRNIMVTFVLGLAFIHPIEAQTPYMKNIKTDNMVHMMGKSIVDAPGLRYGGFTNESPCDSTQELHTVSIYEFTHPTNSAVTVRITVDHTPVADYAVASYLPTTDCDYFQGYIDYAACTTAIDTATLVYTGGIYDYDLFMIKADQNLAVTQSHLIGTERMEQNPYVIESAEHNLSRSPTGDFWLGATRCDVYSGPTDLVVSRLSNASPPSVEWMETIGLITGNWDCINNVNAEVLTSLWGMSDETVLTTFNWRNGFTGCHIMLDANGGFLWGNSYTMSTEMTLVNYSIEDLSSSAVGDIAFVGQMIYAPYTSRFDFCFAEITPAGSGPITTSAANATVYTAYISPGTGHHLYPAQIIQSGTDYLVCGTAENMSTHVYSSFVVKINGSDGTIVWQNCFNVGNRSEAQAVSVRANGDVWVAGNTDLEQNTPFSTWKNYYLAKLDATDGSMVQAHYFDEDNYQSCVNLLAPQTGEHILEGYHYTSSITFERFFVKADPDGIALLCSSIPVVPTDLGLLISDTTGTLDLDAFDSTQVLITPVTPDVQCLDTEVIDMGCEDCNCDEFSASEE